LRFHSIAVDHLSLLWAGKLSLPDNPDDLESQSAPGAVAPWRQAGWSDKFYSHSAALIAGSGPLPPQGRQWCSSEAWCVQWFWRQRWECRPLLQREEM